MSGVPPAERWSVAWAVRAAVVGALAWGLGSLAGYALAHEPSSSSPSSSSPPSASASASSQAPASPPSSRGPAPERPPSEAELALVAPLHAGAALEDFVVAEVHPVKGGKLALQCRAGEKTVWLDVVLAGPSAPPPAASAGPYAIYYSTRGEAAPDDGGRLAQALSRVLAQGAVARGVAPPPGLGVFSPEGQGPRQAAGGAPAAN